MEATKTNATTWRMAAPRAAWTAAATSLLLAGVPVPLQARDRFGGAEHDHAPPLEQHEIGRAGDVLVATVLAADRHHDDETAQTLGRQRIDREPDPGIGHGQRAQLEALRHLEVARV